MKRDAQVGIGLLGAGAAAYLASSTPFAGRYRGPLMVGGLASMAVGLYYLLFQGGGDTAHGGKVAGAAGTLEGLLIGHSPDETSTPAPTITLPPAPDVPQLAHVIPYTGELLVPSPGGTASRLPFRAFYEVLVEITNNTSHAVVGALEVKTKETGTYGGVDLFAKVLEGVEVKAGGTVHQVVVIETGAGAFTNSHVLATVKFNGHHLFTSSWWVQ